MCACACTPVRMQHADGLQFTCGVLVHRSVLAYNCTSCSAPTHIRAPRAAVFLLDSASGAASSARRVRIRPNSCMLP
jgi:hypothetical protein